mgnify:CR=1 FL=1
MKAGTDGPGSPAERVRRTMLRTIVRFGLVEEGDRILVAVSGGKDSLALLEMLLGARRRAPVRFDLLPFHLDAGWPGDDGAALLEWSRGLGAPLAIERHDVRTLVERAQARDPRVSACALCSRLRRGILHSTAVRLGCNKLALGHHREDALQTLLLNLLYAGRLQAMPARYASRDGRLVVVRPLVECAEADVAAHAAVSGCPESPPVACALRESRKRARVERLLSDLEREIPDVRSVMLAALGNVRPTHLLDPEVAAAWEEAAPRFPPRR